MNPKKQSKYSIIVLLSLLLIGCIGTITTTNIDQNSSFKQAQVGSLGASGFWTNFTYIHITGSNWTVAKNYAWCRGDGTWNNPYIIENISIDAASSPTEAGIRISDSHNVYFIIRNCTILNEPSTSGGGIWLDSANNGTIFNNTLENNYRGISLTASENNTIQKSIISDSYGAGIILAAGCTYNNITENSITSGHYQGIYLQSSSDHNILQSNTITDIKLSGYGIAIIIQASDSNNLTDNHLTNNYNGIKLRSGSKDNNIIGNTIEDNTIYGVVLENNTSYPSNNLFYYNHFNNPTALANAYDNGTNNHWNYTTTGNYWNDYSGKDTDDDGRGDTPYLIAGLGGEMDYYPIYDDGPETSNNGGNENPPGGIDGFEISIILGLLSLGGFLFLITQKKKFTKV